MAAEKNSPSDVAYRSREAVAVFDDYDRLVDAIQELETAGFNRSQMNLLTDQRNAEAKVGRKVEDVRELAHEGKAPTGTWVDRHELAEGRTALAGGLGYIGSIAAVGAVVASGGTLAAALAAAVAAGGVSGAAGAWLGGLLSSGHVDEVAKQVANGGLLLWVQIQDPAQEARAVEILERFSARRVELHDITRPWGDEEVPLRDWHPDPLLAKD